MSPQAGMHGAHRGIALHDVAAGECRHCAVMCAGPVSIVRDRAKPAYVGYVCGYCVVLVVHALLAFRARSTVAVAPVEDAPAIRYTSAKGLRDCRPAFRACPVDGNAVALA